MDFAIVALGLILAGLVFIFVLRAGWMIYLARKHGASWERVISAVINGKPIDGDR